MIHFCTKFHALHSYKTIHRGRYRAILASPSFHQTRCTYKIQWPFACVLAAINSAGPIGPLHVPRFEYPFNHVICQVGLPLIYFCYWLTYVHLQDSLSSHLVSKTSKDKSELLSVVITLFLLSCQRTKALNFLNGTLQIWTCKMTTDKLLKDYQNCCDLFFFSGWLIYWSIITVMDIHDLKT